MTEKNYNDGEQPLSSKTRVSRKERYKNLFQLEIRKWSTWLSATGISLLGAWNVDPSVFLWAWNALPGEVKRIIPPNWAIALAAIAFVLSFLAKFIPENRLDKWRRH